jgi:hypothetical protein
LERSRIVSMEKFDLDAECDFRRLTSDEEIEAACLYEYMRESKALRDAVGGQKKGALVERRTEVATHCVCFGLWRWAMPKRTQTPQVPLSFGHRLSFPDLFCLVLALEKSGFPRPWQQLGKASREQLVWLLIKSRRGTMRGDKALYPPVVIEQASVEFDRYGETADQYYHWRLEPAEPRLLEKYEQSGRDYFFGFIRIDRRYNETEAVEAFKKEFRKRWGKTKGGNRERSRAKLNDLVVMRLWNRFPRREDAIKRVEHVAKYTTAGFQGCNDWWKNRCKAIKEKLESGVDQQISDLANEEMSRACPDALKFFQTFFPGEIPLSCPRRTTLAATRKQMKTS